MENEARSLLFDRLVDHDHYSAREIRPLRTLDRRELRDSVRRELERLFNTRCPVPVDRLHNRERSVIDYGIPDFSTFSAARFEDLERLAGILRRTIEAYEPRLKQVRVELQPVEGDHQAVRGRVDGLLVVGSVAEPVSFPTIFQDSSGEVRVDESG